ncbi:heat shock 70 kDa protein 12A-like [Mya arenaria]|uniref:heat shock 70 kDa protein 12A-like n=1 Tax=Mya arenaria TaxID=6604 RepID=UPI0022DF13EF|nr:heat shock 70 kDa protein 12A-like [Mya arenaria]XP_052812350.1 heat shock 70 kDa protein 12A-like [Mya arenaria]
MPRDKHMVVAAIDFGSTYSGYAFQFRGSDKICTVSSFHGSTVTYKTPTVILFDKDKNFNSFGYQAENKYAELAELDNHVGWRNFRCFKMELYRSKEQRKLRVTSKLKDDQGQTMDIIDVFGGAIKFLREELLETLLANAPRFEENDIKWLITVPAIWEDAAKQIMVLAAEKAGIARENLQLVYEPEAAAIFCKNEYSTAVDSRQKDIFKPGSNFILVDLGGGTVDITAHKVNDDGTLDALVPPSGGPWGGHNVNKKLFELLEDLFGAEVFRKFSAEEKDEQLELERSFEVKKRQDGQFSIKLPARLIELAGETKMKEIKHSQKVSFRKDKLFVNDTAVLGIFKETVEHTIVHVSKILQKADLQNVSTIVLVGGFAESKVLQQEFKSRFNPKQYLLVIPQAPELAVLKGAALYGLNESLIRSHRMPYTVGIDAAVEFEEGRHPAKLRHFQNGSFKCTGIFKVFIERGTQIQPNTASAEHKFRAPNPEEAVIELYKSDGDDIPTYTEDCRRLGEVKLILIAPTQADQTKKDVSTKGNPMINVQMYFGDTLVTVKADEVGTNNSVIADINFLL